MRDLGLADRIRAAGIPVVEVDGWQTRGSDSFNPRGGVDHHTAGSNNGDAPSLEICTNGRSDLPGPLCNVLQGFSGTAYVVASGRANHAGDGGWHGLSGNSSVYGMERENDGHSPPRPGQHELAARTWAAICTGGPAGTIDASMVCGHKEWTTRKPDFHDVDYGWFRTLIAQGGPPPPPPPSSEDPTMATFVVINGLGYYSVIGNVLFRYNSAEEYSSCVDASEGVPVKKISDKIPLAGRQWLVDRLQEQSDVATGMR